MLDYDEYKIVMKNIQQGIELKERFQANPGLEDFYKADSNDPKDEKLVFEEWKPLAKTIDPN